MRGQQNQQMDTRLYDDSALEGLMSQTTQDEQMKDHPQFSSSTSDSPKIENQDTSISSVSYGE